MKKVLYVIIGLVVIYLILCLVGPKEATVVRSATINAPVDVVKMKMADLKFFQEQWSPWSERDPQMKVTYLGEMGQPGYGYSWTGNKEVGTGTLQITGVSGDSLLQKLTLEGMGDSKMFLVVNGKDAGTNVTWGIDMDFGFFGRGVMLFMPMDKMMGADFESGLGKLKKAIESMPAEPVAATYDVKELQWDEKTFVGKKELVAFDKISEFYGTNLGKIMGELGKNKIEPQMAPLGIFWTFDEQKQQTEMAAAIAVPKGTKLKGYETWNVPASKVLHIVYYGDYAKSMAAHMAMDEYMTKNNLQQSLVVEEYANDPGEVKDTAQWITNIYYILKPSEK
jgi:effector-binding domain-containing protein